MQDLRTRRPASSAASQGHLLTRPDRSGRKAGGDVRHGVQRLGLGGKRDGLVYVPASYRGNCPVPMALLLHGAGGHAIHGLDLLRNLADQWDLLLVAVDSRGRTWDMILDGYGPDVTFIDSALEHVLNHYTVDPDTLAVGGFSDGASYALSLGIANGDLFTHVIAFSPGYMAPTRQQGAPRLYISHGTADRVLPIDRCSRRLVPRLEEAGYDLHYHEFQGPHTVPHDIAQEAVEWLLGE